MRSDWLPTGDMVRYRWKGSVWLENTRYVLSRDELPQKTATGRRVTRLSYRTPTGELFDNAYEVDEDGRVLSLISYGRYGIPRETCRYGPNGALVKKIESPVSAMLLRINSVSQAALTRPTAMTYHRSWFPSGQLRQHTGKDALTQIEHIDAVWDVNGHQLVVNGEGMAVLQAWEEPEADTAKAVEFIETGLVVKRLRQGIWMGRPASTSYFPDQAYYYEERYKDGILEVGASVLGSDTAVYTVTEQRPRFIGGEPGFQQFLDEQLTKKPTKRSSREPCCVEVSFMVLPDGTLRNYVITKPIQPDLDQHALQIAHATHGHWKPGTRRGRPVPMRSFVSIPANRL